MKNFRVQVSLRIILIALTLFLSFYIYFENEFFVAVVLISLTVVQVFFLFKYIDTVNVEIKKIIQGLNYSDFSQNITLADKGKTFKELATELNRVLERFRQARMDKEESLKYLETVVEHVGIGLVCFDSKGNIELLNRTAKRLLKTPNLKNVSSLDKKFPQFGNFLFKMNVNKKQTYKLNSNGEILQLLLSAIEFRMKNQNMKLISFYNIQEELEEKEIEAWQKLIRVLTHEIMNSITPISSLASTVNLMLKDSIDDKSNSESLNEIREAVSTIQKRSEWLVNFVNKYRDISKIPKPNFQSIKVAELFYRIRLLAETLINNNKINFNIKVNPDNLEIIADPDLIEQVILNLINNSVHALYGTENPVIKLSAEINDRSKAIIKLTDNGPGIPEELLDKIFIPFYSTKKEGSGIGLSISQSIIRAHNGSIWVQSKTNEETTFTIVLN